MMIRMIGDTRYGNILDGKLFGKEILVMGKYSERKFAGEIHSKNINYC